MTSWRKLSKHCDNFLRNNVMHTLSTSKNVQSRYLLHNVKLKHLGHYLISNVRKCTRLPPGLEAWKWEYIYPTSLASKNYVLQWCILSMIHNWTNRQKSMLYNNVGEPEWALHYFFCMYVNISTPFMCSIYHECMQLLSPSQQVNVWPVKTMVNGLAGIKVGELV